MTAKHIIFLGAFIFTLSLLPAQRLQQGLSIGGPITGHFTPIDFYYNGIGSPGLFEGVFQVSPAYSLTYAFAPQGRRQWFVKHSGIVVAYRSWESPEYYIRLGGGRTHYLPFAPAWQWQWEIGGQLDRLYSPFNFDVSRVHWGVLPYASINLQTTSLGKHLIAGMGMELSNNSDFSSVAEDVRLVANVAWAIKSRDQNPSFEPPTLTDASKKIHLQYQHARYGSWDYYGEDYLTDMRSLVGEYWWGEQKQWRMASRLGIGFGATTIGDKGINYDWLLHMEQNFYLRLGEHFSLLPFGGVGLLSGQVWLEEYVNNVPRDIIKNLFRPYLKGGFRIQAPHHRIFAEFSASTVPSFQAGLGVRLGRR